MSVVRREDIRVDPRMTDFLVFFFVFLKATTLTDGKVGVYLAYFYPLGFFAYIYKGEEGSLFWSQRG